MLPWLRAVVAIAAFAIRRDFQTGIAGDGLYRFRSDDNSLGFGAIVAGKAFVVCFGLAEIRTAMGVGDDPMALLRRILG